VLTQLQRTIADMNLVNEFTYSFRGKPWHGKNALEIIEASDPEKVFVHWIPNAHSIAELVSHLSGWTREVLERLNGQGAKEPLRGDWPEIAETSHDAWKKIVEEFRSAHQSLEEHITSMDSNDWERLAIDDRDDFEKSTCSYAEMVNGIVQHLAYHAGQISLLQKF
jgi:uncharacterized damage-inducible protein DinB